MSRLLPLAASPPYTEQAERLTATRLYIGSSFPLSLSFYHFGSKDNKALGLVPGVPLANRMLTNIYYWRNCDFFFFLKAVVLCRASQPVGIYPTLLPPPLKHTPANPCILGVLVEVSALSWTSQLLSQAPCTSQISPAATRTAAGHLSMKLPELDPKRTFPRSLPSSVPVLVCFWQEF